MSYRAVVQRGYNAADPVSTLELVLKPIPTPAPGEVVVHITVRPVNPTDLLSIRSGRLVKDKDSATIGSEGFGIVEAIGEGVTVVKPGQRVVPMGWGDGYPIGSWQEFVNVKEDMVIPIPDSISDEAAAQFIINPWTVIGLLRDLNVPKGEYVIQTAAGSVLGRQLIQIAKYQGIKTINIVRRPEQKEELFALGADEVICSTTEDVLGRVKKITSGKLAYGAVECVGGTITKVVLQSVRDNGEVLIYGVLGSTDATVGIMDLFRGVSIRSWTLHRILVIKEEIIKQALTLLEQKVFEPLIGEKFDLADFKKAIEKSESVGRGGKVLLTSAPKLEN